MCDDFNRFASVVNFDSFEREIFAVDFVSIDGKTKLAAARATIVSI